MPTSNHNTWWVHIRSIISLFVNNTLYGSNFKETLKSIQKQLQRNFVIALCGFTLLTFWPFFNINGLRPWWTTLSVNQRIREISDFVAESNGYRTCTRQKDDARTSIFRLTVYILYCDLWFSNVKLFFYIDLPGCKYVVIRHGHVCLSHSPKKMLFVYQTTKINLNNWHSSFEVWTIQQKCGNFHEKLMKCNFLKFAGNCKILLLAKMFWASKTGHPKKTTSAPTLKCWGQKKNTIFSVS